MNKGGKINKQLSQALSSAPDAADSMDLFVLPTVRSSVKRERERESTIAMYHIPIIVTVIVKHTVIPLHRVMTAKNPAQSLLANICKVYALIPVITSSVTLVSRLMVVTDFYFCYECSLSKNCFVLYLLTVTSKYIVKLNRF